MVKNIIITLFVLNFFTPLVFAGKGVGEDAAYAREMGFEQRFYYGSSGGALDKIEYICRAFPGTTGSGNTASSVWQVQRFTYNAGGQITEIEFAGDDDAFNQVCDNRTSLDYD